MIALVGCSPFAPTPTPIVFDEPLPDDPGPDVGGRALQQEVFADGKVTDAEYERAVIATVACIRQEGFIVQGPLRYPDGPITVAPGEDPTRRLGVIMRAVNPEDDARSGEVSGRCQAQWSYAIERVYLDQFAPTEAEIQAWLERAWACMREQGIEVSDRPTELEAMDSVAYGCKPWESED